jgi:pseudouridine synthase
MKLIIQKIIAQRGYCSRRNGEQLIRDGLVKVNGEIAQIGEQADPEKDRISVQGHPIKRAASPIYLKLNKPLGYTCSNRRFEGEKNIFDLVKTNERLFAVGRLDKNSRGLVLLTNDGELTQKLSHPKFEHEKSYAVKIAGNSINDEFIAKKLLGGIDIGDDDGIVRARKVKYLQNNIFIITLGEGKKRQIRRMFGGLGFDVLDLKRIEIAGLKLGGLKEGQWVDLTEAEIEKIRK